MSTEHKTLQVGSIHRVANWEFATIAARDAQSVVTSDIGKVGYVSGYGNYVLINVSPIIWERLSAAVAIAYFIPDEAYFPTFEAALNVEDIGKVVHVATNGLILAITAVSPSVTYKALSAGVTYATFAAFAAVRPLKADTFVTITADETHGGVITHYFHKAASNGMSRFTTTEV